MADKFIPNSDRKFASMAQSFALTIARDPARFMLSADDAARITQAVSKFRDALSVAIRPGTRTRITTLQKDEARVAAESIVRKYGNLIRANADISGADKLTVFIKERVARPRKTACPQTPPALCFVGSTGEAGSTGAQHVLRFREHLTSGTRAKPDGAQRLELFVELVAEGEPMPTHPGQLSGGRPWYLRAFTKSPMRVTFPMPATPMLVVYWGRWASTTGEFGPFSRTCKARVEGWSHASKALADETEPQRRQTKCIVTLREATFASLPEPARQQRQLPEAA